MTTENKHILLAEDDVNLGYLMAENLKAKGFEVTLAKNGHEALAAISGRKFALCILDVMMAGLDGFSVAIHIRQQYPSVPFIFVTARLTEQDKLRGFETGADDYITKPFSFKELYCRILVVLRRGGTGYTNVPVESSVSIGQIVLFPSERLLEVNGRSKKLSQRESAILHLLMRQSGMYISRSEILQKIWGTDDYFTAKSMDVYITRIRKLLKDANAIEVENLYGVGYRIKALNEA
ncbi:MAG: two component transcriptional regulator, winged helix family [Bacteroidetes bacterium]|nr:two component transcriptional regulator, winged helix family [Bacteroidota bacterium]